jgi:hypothetical protein
MIKIVLIWAALLTMLIGCASYLAHERSSSNDIPFYKRRPPSLNAAIIIDVKGPQLDPIHYEILGKAMSHASNPSPLVNHCKDAMEMLRYEAETVGGDALINISCSLDTYNADASGTIILFKNRQEAMRILKQIHAVLQ